MLARRLDDSLDGRISLSLVLHVNVSSIGQLSFNGSATIDAHDHVCLCLGLLVYPLGRTGTYICLRNVAIRWDVCVRPLEMLSWVLGRVWKGMGRVVQVRVYYGYIRSAISSLSSSWAPLLASRCTGSCLRRSLLVSATLESITQARCNLAPSIIKTHINKRILLLSA